MNPSKQHLRGHAGASFTKAVACACCVQMRQICVDSWTVKSTGAGYPA